MYVLCLLPLILQAAHFESKGYVQDNRLRISSSPYLSGDTFRSFADFVLDEASNNNIDPDKVKNGDVIFVTYDRLNRFLTQTHPKINAKYILLTHNRDEGIPGSFASYLDDPKLIAWFGQNVELAHKKLLPLPIGIANHYWPIHGNTKSIEEVKSKNYNTTKKHLLYMNCSVATNPKERIPIYNMFKDKQFCKVAGHRGISSHDAQKEYLRELAQSKFVVSPRGNGLDCHRTWEALYMNSCPVIKTSPIDSLFVDLPVIIVKDWSEVTETFLNKKYQELKNKNYNFKKLYAAYWFDIINSYRKR